MMGFNSHKGECYYPPTTMFAKQHILWAIVSSSVWTLSSSHVFALSSLLLESSVRICMLPCHGGRACNLSSYQYHLNKIYTRAHRMISAARYAGQGMRDGKHPISFGIRNRRQAQQLPTTQRLLHRSPTNLSASYWVWRVTPEQRSIIQLPRMTCRSLLPVGERRPFSVL